MKILSILMAAAFSVAATAAAQADGVGRAVAVIDAATASGQIGDRALAVGSAVYVGDLVQTDGGGEAQLLFDDGTRMVVGANSSLVIEEFLFRGKAAENRFAVRALSGAFRFISGDSGDENYTIRTPTGTIGVRGTAFDFTVAPEGGTKLLLLAGEATLCGESGACATVATPCGLLRTDDGRQVAEIAAAHGRAEEARRSFPLLTMQSRLLEPYRVEGQACTAEMTAG